MPKKAVELGALQVGRLKKPGAHAVGGVAGLQLKVNDAGARSWVLRAMIAGKRRDMGLGGFPDVTLAQARERARAARDLIDAGSDPVQLRQAARSAAAAAHAKAKTFDQCVEGFMKAKSGEWRNAKHRAQWQSTLDNYASPVFGNVLVQDVELAHVLKVLEDIWTTKTETASRLRGRIETILNWATARGFRTGDNPARWRGHLDHMLAKPRKIATVKHHPAVKIDDVHKFMIELRRMEGIGARALEFAILTAGRSGEVRGARWHEIDMREKVWTVPAERMKAKKEHRVPLSRQVMKLLDGLPRIEGSDVVFPGAKGKPLSDMALTACMRRMKLDAVPHGFRSTFRDWASEKTTFPREVAEMALAHTIESAVEAAYRRGDLLKKRTSMMQAWADYCDTPPIKGANVVPIRAA
ncbi:integrase arm-type DNA-binding domain-containing protein [Variovorax sp. J22R133]|uniref:tyrosine-type recombinase/integrase n=1 Tax=Variovorax brevis TaxID=3053503 RepID=UPI0025771FBE|nr:site-specific integrase [Variovorax sp. J22R133]MDM0113924.1 integrase arm-type DNA-binding domain-containing protein [Variovorax sp. J22R133]